MEVRGRRRLLPSDNVFDVEALIRLPSRGQIHHALKTTRHTGSNTNYMDVVVPRMSARRSISTRKSSAVGFVPFDIRASCAIAHHPGKFCRTKDLT